MKIQHSWLTAYRGGWN